MTIPNVTIEVLDNASAAAVTLPQQTVQVVMGCCTLDSASPLMSNPLATSNAQTLTSNLGYGPVVQAGGMICRAGGVCIAVPVPITTTGTKTAVTATATGGSTSVVTASFVNGAIGAYDDYYIEARCVTGGTIGTTGCQIQVSLDAGRTYGPVINLFEALTYTISNTGIILTFGAGTIVADDYWRLSTVAPLWAVGDIQTALDNLSASQYALAGWGSLHIVGKCTASVVSTIQGYVESLASRYIFTRALFESRDAKAPTAWGGSGETETAWINALALDFSALSAKRACVGAGYYNMPSPYPNSSAGTPSYRRPITWADAVRRVLVPPQRRGGRVRDGALANIVVNPSVDPTDGFIYHDEREDPGLDAARFLSAMTWAKYQGFFVCHENLMAQTGSQFTDLTLGNVIDIACDIGYATGAQEISDDLRLKASGTLYEGDALTLQNTIDSALSANMTAVKMVSDAYSSVNRLTNVRATSNIPIEISVLPRGYVNTITETINLVP